MSLKFALEDNEDLVPDETVEEVPAEVEADVAAVSEDAGELEGQIEETDAAAEDTRALQEIGDVVEESTVPDENGNGGDGLDPVAARVTEIAVEHLCNRIFGKKHSMKKAMPGLEAFGSTSGRVAATKISCEGIKEYAIKAWEALKKAWNFIISKIVEFWKKLFDANTKLANSAKSLGAAADKAKGKTAAAVAFDSAEIAAGFAGRGSEATAADVEKVLKAHGAAIDNIVKFATATEGTMKGFEGILEKVKAQKKDEGAQVVDNKAIQEKLTNLVEELAASTKIGFKGAEAGGLVDGGSFNVDFTAGEGSTAAYIKAEFKSEPSKATKVKTLSAEEAASVAKAVETLSKQVAALQAKKGLLTNIQKSIDSLISKAVAKAGSLEGNEDGAKELKGALESAKQYTHQLGQVYGQVAITLPKLSIRAEKLALNYVSASLAQYKKSKED